MSAAELDRTYRRKMEATTTETHHAFYEWAVDGRIVIATKLSTPFHRDIGAGLIATIAREQLRLPEGSRQLRQLVQCTMSREQWWEHVRRVARTEDRIRP